MGVRATDHTQEALYDSVTGRVFGPVFGLGEADDFLDWLKDQYDQGAKFKYGNETLLYIEDPRMYRQWELEQVVQNFRDSQ